MLWEWTYFINGTGWQREDKWQPNAMAVMLKESIKDWVCGGAWLATLIDTALYYNDETKGGKRGWGGVREPNFNFTLGQHSWAPKVRKKSSYLWRIYCHSFLFSDLRLLLCSRVFVNLKCLIPRAIIPGRGGCWDLSSCSRFYSLFNECETLLAADDNTWTSWKPRSKIRFEKYANIVEQKPDG